MDLAVNVNFPFGQAQLAATSVCVVALGAAALHFYVQNLAAQDKVQFGLGQTKKNYILLGICFMSFLACTGLLHSGVISTPTVWSSEGHFSQAVAYGVGGTLLGMIGVMVQAWRKHADHHNH